jgi:hypothetical protein
MVPLVETNYDDKIDLNKISPLLNFTINSNSVDTLNGIISDSTKGHEMKVATIYSKSENKNLLLTEKRVSKRLSLKGENISKFILENDFIKYLDSKNNNFKWSLLDHHYDIVEYDTGGFFKKHRDYQWFYSPNTIQMTCLIGLKDCEKGGSTQLWFPKSFQPELENRDLECTNTTKKGGVLIFPSHWFHSGNPIINGTKRILMMTLSCEYQKYPNSDRIHFKQGVYFTSYAEIVSGNIYKSKNKITGGSNKVIKGNKDVNEEYIFINTIDKKKVKILKGILKGTNIELLYNLQGDELYLPYNSCELNITLRYLMNEDIPIDMLNTKSREKTYLDILKELGILDPMLINFGLETDSTNMRILERLFNESIKIGLWSSFHPWMVDICNKFKCFIPFVIINEFKNNIPISYKISLYNCEDLNIGKFRKYQSPFLGNVRAYIKHLQGCLCNQDEIEDYNYSHDHKQYSKKDFDGTKYYLLQGNIIKILEETGQLYPTKFNIDNWKKTYLKNDLYDGSLMRGYDSYDDYESDDYCNGWEIDDYGGYYKDDEENKEGKKKEYETQLITVRYGLCLDISD